MHHAMKKYGEVEVQLYAFLTLGLEGVSGQLHAAVALIPGQFDSIHFTTAKLLQVHFNNIFYHKQRYPSVSF
jgi:hypothetical protein